MTGRAKRVTIRTVAEDAGVSVAAVSKVLRNSYGVSERMREKVQASMNKLGYRPHMAARGLRGKTFTIGLLQNDLRNPYLPTIFDGIFKGLEGSGFQPLLGVGQSTEPLETALINAMIDRQMDGLIMVAPRLPGEKIEQFAREVPTCIIAHHHPDEDAFDTVNFDDNLGARAAVRHLIEQGCQSIVMLSQALPEPGVSNVIQQRELGFMDAMGVVCEQPSEAIVHGFFDAASTDTLIRELLQRPNPPDGLFCWSDMVATQVFVAAAEIGLRIPEDIAVVGYDNTYDDQLRPFGLSSLNQPGYQLGVTAAQLLLSRIEGRSEAEHKVFSPELIVRASSLRSDDT